jgi:hypothetical protein
VRSAGAGSTKSPNPTSICKQYAGAVQACRHPHPHAFVFSIFPDFLAPDCSRIEDDSVFSRHRADLADSLRDLADLRTAETRKIPILGWPVQLPVPRNERHRALPRGAALDEQG